MMEDAVRKRMCVYICVCVCVCVCVYIYTQLAHFAIQQELTEHCKSIIIKIFEKKQFLKINLKKKKPTSPFQKDIFSMLQ